MILARKYVRARNLFFGLQRSFGKDLSPYLEPRNLATIACLAFIYLIVGKVVHRPGSPNHSVTEIWLPAGIALAAFLLRGNRVWPGAFIGALLLSVTITGSISISLGLALGNTLEALLAAHLVNKYANGINAFFKTRDVLRFIFFAAMLAPALCAVLGVGLLCLGGFASWTDFPPLWFVWWVGDMLGVLFLTPFLVLLLGHKHRFFGLAEPLEITALIAGLSVVCVLNFGQRPLPWLPGNGLLFLCAPFLVWSALRFCPLEAAGAAFVMGGFTVWGSVHGLGPFGNAIGLPLFVGGFMAVGTAMTMTIAAANAEQKSATKDVLGMYCVLKDVKESEIRVLQDTVEALRVELAKNRSRRASPSSQEGTP
ncbi:MAG TPA: MASE1 domain-containing protein [Candidatus Acidoferrales bacterium]